MIYHSKMTTVINVHAAIKIENTAQKCVCMCDKIKLDLNMPQPH